MAVDSVLFPGLSSPLYSWCCMSTLHLTKPAPLCFLDVFQPVRSVTTVLWPLMAPVPSVRSTVTPSERDPPPVLATRDTFARKRTQHPWPVPVSTSTGIHDIQRISSKSWWATGLQWFVNSWIYLARHGAVYCIYDAAHSNNLILTLLNLSCCTIIHVALSLLYVW